MVRYLGRLRKPLSCDDENMVELAEVLSSMQRSLRMKVLDRRMARAMSDLVNALDFGDDCERYYERVLSEGSFANCYYELLRKFGTSPSADVDRLVKRQTALLEEFYDWTEAPSPPNSPRFTLDE
jgi:hypothetical protein